MSFTSVGGLIAWWHLALFPPPMLSVAKILAGSPRAAFPEPILRRLQLGSATEMSLVLSAGRRRLWASFIFIENLMHIYNVFWHSPPPFRSFQFDSYFSTTFTSQTYMPACSINIPYLVLSSPTLSPLSATWTRVSKLEYPQKAEN